MQRLVCSALSLSPAGLSRTRGPFQRIKLTHEQRVRKTSEALAKFLPSYRDWVNRIKKNHAGSHFEHIAVNHLITIEAYNQVLLTPDCPKNFTDSNGIRSILLHLRGARLYRHLMVKCIPFREKELAGIGGFLPAIKGPGPYKSTSLNYTFEAALSLGMIKKLPTPIKSKHSSEIDLESDD